jgi:hypothetical protein
MVSSEAMGPVYTVLEMVEIFPGKRPRVVFYRSKVVRHGHAHLVKIPLTRNCQNPFKKGK